MGVTTLIRNFSLLAVCIGFASAGNTAFGRSKAEKRAISLFNIITFDNDACQSLDTVVGSSGSRRNGTCFTMDECETRGGTHSGNCASGFGVCCVFAITASGGEVNQNCSYVQNPGFPMAYMDSSSLTYSIKKCDKKICKFRLDFEQFSIAGPAESELDGGICDTDYMSVTSSNTGVVIPKICGMNNGQHMYIDAGPGDSNSATLHFMFNDAGQRRFDIKVSQIQCGTNFNAPDGCLQWFTGPTGRFETFNYEGGDGHLAEQHYSACIRPEVGYCCVQYQSCTDIDAFTVSDVATAQRSADCATADFIGIEASSYDCQTAGSRGLTAGEVANRFCGQIFAHSFDAVIPSPVCDCSPPFVLHVNFNDLSDIDADNTESNPNTLPSRGACLDYTMVKC